MRITIIKSLMLSLLFLTACQQNASTVLPTATEQHPSSEISAPTTIPATPVETPAGTIVPTATPEPEVDSILPLFEVGWDDRTAFSQGLISSQRDVLAQLPGATVYHLDFGISDDSG